MFGVSRSRPQWWSILALPPSTVNLLANDGGRGAGVNLHLQVFVIDLHSHHQRGYSCLSCRDFEHRIRVFGVLLHCVTQVMHPLGTSVTSLGVASARVLRLGFATTRSSQVPLLATAVTFGLFEPTLVW